MNKKPVPTTWSLMKVLHSLVWAPAVSRLWWITGRQQVMTVYCLPLPWETHTDTHTQYIHPIWPRLEVGERWKAQPSVSGFSGEGGQAWRPSHMSWSMGGRGGGGGIADGKEGNHETTRMPPGGRGGEGSSGRGRAARSRRASARIQTDEAAGRWTRWISISHEQAAPPPALPSAGV